MQARPLFLSSQELLSLAASLLFHFHFQLCLGEFVGFELVNMRPPSIFEQQLQLAGLCGFVELRDHGEQVGLADLVVVDPCEDGVGVAADGHPGGQNVVFPLVGLGGAHDGELHNDIRVYFALADELKDVLPALRACQQIHLILLPTPRPALPQNGLQLDSSGGPDPEQHLIVEGLGDDVAAESASEVVVKKGELFRCIEAEAAVGGVAEHIVRQ